MTDEPRRDESADSQAEAEERAGGISDSVKEQIRREAERAVARAIAPLVARIGALERAVGAASDVPLSPYDGDSTAASPATMLDGGQD